MNKQQYFLQIKSAKQPSLFQQKFEFLKNIFQDLNLFYYSESKISSSCLSTIKIRLS